MITQLNYSKTSSKSDFTTKEISNILKNQDGIFVGEIYFHCDEKRTRSYDLKKEISNFPLISVCI